MPDMARRTQGFYVRDFWILTTSMIINLTKEDYMKSIETLPVMASRRLIFVDGMVLDKDRVKVRGQAWLYYRQL